MARNVKPELLVEIDLNSPSFQSTWNNLEQIEQEKAIATFEKLTQLTWNQVYKDKGLRWEKIHSIQAPQGIDALYSFRVSKSIRGIGFRQDHFLRVLLIEPDHDAAYGKNKGNLRISESKQSLAQQCPRPYQDDLAFHLFWL